MVPTFLFQSAGEPAPITGIDGVLLAILLALATVSPALFKEVVNVLKSIAARFNSSAESQVKNTEAFQYILQEVTYLRQERDQQEKRIEQAETKATEAIKSFEEMRKRATESEKMILELKVQMDILQNQLNRTSDENRGFRAENMILKEQLIKVTVERDDLKIKLGLT